MNGMTAGDSRMAMNFPDHLFQVFYYGRGELHTLNRMVKKKLNGIQSR